MGWQVMKKLTTRLLIFLLVSFLSIFSMPNISANESGESYAFDLTIIHGEGNVLKPELPNLPHGTQLEIDLTGIEIPGKNFVFYIIDNQIVRDQMQKFTVTSHAKVTAVFAAEDEIVAVFMDTNGEYISADYVTTGEVPTAPDVSGLSKPGYNPVPFGDLGAIDDHKIFVVSYEPSSETMILVNDVEYPYNSIVTLKSDNPDFTHWEENGVVVSYNPEYKFSAIYNRDIVEKTDGAKQTLITLTNGLTLRLDDLVSFIGQYELNNDEVFIEAGILGSYTFEETLTLDTPGVEVIVSNSIHPLTNEFTRTINNSEFVVVRGYLRTNLGTYYSDNQVVNDNFDEFEAAESFEVNDEFTGYYTGEGTPTFGDLQGEDFGITSIKETSPGVYTIVLSGTVKVFDDNHDNPNRFGHGGIVALLGLKYNLPPAYANADGLTDIGVVWTTPIQSQAAFDSGYKWRGSVDTGNYDSLILTSNVYSLKDEDFLKFAVNWGGTKDEGTGYVEYILDIRDVVFEEVSVTGVAVNEEALALMALEEAQLEATIAPTNAVNKEVTWRSSDETVAIVDENGLVTGLRAGEAIITVETVDGSYTAQTTVIVLPTIAEVRALSKGTETEFVGVVTGFTDYSEQYSNFDKVFIEDSTAAIVVYRAGFPQDLKVGDRYKVTGKLDSFNGLIQIASGATVEKLESDIELIAPVEVTDLTEIDESYQGKRVDLEGTVVSVSSTGQSLVVKVGENQITVRSNSNSADHTVNSHLLTAIVGQVVKLHGIHVDWYNGSQLIPTLVEQVEFVMPSDKELAQLVLDAIVNEWENKSFNMGTDATLPQTGDHDSTIAWTIPEGAIVEGKWNDVTADTTYAVTVVVTIGDEEVSKVFDITVKFVDGEIIEPTTVEAVFTAHGTNVPSGDITSMFGLDEEIFAIHQVNNEA